MAVAPTIGIDMPADFPTTEHDSVNVQLAPYQPKTPIVWGEYAGGWNAVAIRFKTAADADDRFTASIAQSASPAPYPRQAQEEDLFTFFVAGFASIESFAYACFALGAMLQPANFPTATPQDLTRIKPITSNVSSRYTFRGRRLAQPFPRFCRTGRSINGDLFATSLRTARHRRDSTK